MLRKNCRKKLQVFAICSYTSMLLWSEVAAIHTIQRVYNLSNTHWCLVVWQQHAVCSEPSPQWRHAIQQGQSWPETPWIGYTFDFLLIFLFTISIFSSETTYVAATHRNEIKMFCLSPYSYAYNYYSVFNRVIISERISVGL